MKKYFLWLVVLLSSVLGLAACGGGSHTTATKPKLVQTVTTSTGQRVYKVKLPNGHVVEQAHSPTLAEPPKGLQLPRPASLSSTVEQYDSTDVGAIPRSAHYVAGYVDGHWRTYFQLKGHFPVVVGISVATKDGADCFDMEPGNPGPQNAGPWAKFQFSAGNSRPCEYSMLSWMSAIKANLAANHVSICTNATSDRCVRLWDANWTFTRHLDSGYPCTQWTDHADGLNRDESTCANWFYHRAAVLHVCYHHRISTSQCAAAKKQVAAWQKAVTSSTGAYKARHCAVFAQRVAFFSHVIKIQPHSPKTASRKRALAASQKVYKTRACHVFASRAGYYGSLINQLESKN